MHSIPTNGHPVRTNGNQSISKSHWSLRTSLDQSGLIWTNLSPSLSALLFLSRIFFPCPYLSRASPANNEGLSSETILVPSWASQRMYEHIYTCNIHACAYNIYIYYIHMVCLFVCVPRSWSRPALPSLWKDSFFEPRTRHIWQGYKTRLKNAAISTLVDPAGLMMTNQNWSGCGFNKRLATISWAAPSRSDLSPVAGWWCTRSYWTTNIMVTPGTNSDQQWWRLMVDPYQ